LQPQQIIALRLALVELAVYRPQALQQPKEVQAQFLGLV
jgi:hypothetical protein